MKILKLFIALTTLVLCAGQSSQPIYEIDYIGTLTACTTGHGILCTDLSAYPYVYADAYNMSGGDGGGGYFYMNNSATSCPSNGGTVVHDGKSPTANCFYRANPTNDVREYGAKCDVVSLSNNANNGTIGWNIIDMIHITIAGMQSPAALPDVIPPHSSSPALCGRPNFLRGPPKENGSPGRAVSRAG